MTVMQIVVLSVIQGFAELLPVSSSAHVIIAEKLMGIDPSSPQMTFMLVMLHTGTTFAVILYFWSRWRERLGRSEDRPGIVKALFVATAATGAVGLALKLLIEKLWLRGAAHQEVEALFSNLPLIATALALVGVLIIVAGRRDGDIEESSSLSGGRSLWIGAIQGLCLPFRGFSRSGATISVGLLCGVRRALAEDFSFALSVILTPAVIAQEAHRLWKASAGAGSLPFSAGMFAPGLLGMAFSFVAGLAALRWLSNWLEKGRWRYFGVYCLAAAAGVFCLAQVLP